MIIFPRILQAIIIAQRLQTSRWRLRYTVLAWPSQLLSHWLIYAASLTKSNPQSAELESPKRRNGPIDRVPSVCKYTIQSVDETKQLHSLPHSPVPHLGHITMYSTPHNQYCPCADYATSQDHIIPLRPIYTRWPKKLGHFWLLTSFKVALQHKFFLV